MLNLAGNELAGTIPSEITQLTQLQFLRLENNALTGPIPIDIGSLLELLELGLGGNLLNGQLPESICSLQNLRLLSVEKNRLTGPVPGDIEQLNQLTQLLLYDNQFEGPIPAEIGDLTGLESLRLYSNRFDGLIPPSIGMLSGLRDLDLSNNQLSGEIPASLANLARLEYLSLAGNHLWGPIPAELGRLSKLRSLNLGHNRLEGAIPPVLLGMPQLLRLSLEDNRLSGEIPVTLTALPAAVMDLELLSLSGNYLTGPIPTQLSLLSRLEVLALDNNQLLGLIPSELGNLAQLRVLALANNTLEGELPASLGRLSQLQVLSLRSNYLSGEVPADLLDLSRLGDQQLDLRWNQLSSGNESLEQFLGQKQLGGNWRIRDVFFPFYLEEDVPPQGGSFSGFSISNQADEFVDLQIESFGDLTTCPTDLLNVTLDQGEQVLRLGRDLFCPSALPTAQVGWLRITTSHPEIGTFFQFFNWNLSRMDGSISVERASRRLVFDRIYQGPLAFRGQPAETRIHLVNPNVDPVTVRLTLHLTSIFPAQILDTRVALMPYGLLSMDVEELFDIPEVSEGFLEAEVEEGRGILGFHYVSLGDEQTIFALNPWIEFDASRLYSAQASEIPSLLFTNLKVLNVSDEARTVSLSVFDEVGNNVGETVDYLLLPRETLESDLSELMDLPPSVTGSLEMTANGPGIIGDVVFGDPGQLQFAAALQLQAEPFSGAVFNQVANLEGFFTGLAFFNPGPDPAEIEIGVFSPQGVQTGVRELQLDPFHRISRTVAELVPETEGQRGGYIVVSSTVDIVAQQLFGTNNLTALSAAPPTNSRRR